MSSNEIYNCDNCLQTCRGLRCMGCARTVYCSRKCQKSHWKLVHKHTCTRAQGIQENDEKNAVNTAIELHHEISKMTFNEAEEHMCRAQDEIIRIQENVKDENHYSTLRTLFPRIEERGSSEKHYQDKDNPNDAYICFIEDKWCAQIEELRHIRRFQIVLISPLRSLCTDQIQLLQEENKYCISVFCENQTRKKILTVIVPREICMNEIRVQINDSSFVSITIPYIDTIGNDTFLSDHSTSFQCVPSTTVSSLMCRNCKNKLFPLRSDVSIGLVIRDVLPLPVGHWDEISDYIMCNDENPSLFSTKAVRNYAFEDHVIFLIHEADLQVGCVKIAPIPGYGENEEVYQKKMKNLDEEISYTAKNGYTSISQNGAEYRGERQWQCDQRTGATVCCSSCNKILGFAFLFSDSSICLYKHLVLSDDGGRLALYTCGSFIARELVRYAESQAVYTFIVCVKGEEDFGQAIFLHLVSWNTRVSQVSDGGESVPQGNPRQNFDAVKVIFEERINLTKNDNSIDSIDTNNPMTWNWGNRSFCCPPGIDEVHFPQTKDRGGANEASVKIYVAIDEWIGLKKELKNGSKFVPPSVCEATVKIKLGKSPLFKRAKLSVLNVI